MNIQEIPLFSHLTDKQLNELKDLIFVHSYAKDQILFYEGEKSEYLHVLLEGSVKMFKTTPKGDEVYIHDFHAPDIIAIFASLKDIPFPASCQFTTDGKIGLLPLKRLYQCMHNAEFAMAVTNALSDKMELLAHLIQKETVYTCEAKIAELICRDIDIFKDKKYKEIANMLNIAPATLSRTLTQFKEKNLITSKGHEIIIVDKEKLLEVVENNGFVA